MAKSGRKKQQVVFVPVHGLEISRKLNREIAIGRVTFVAADKIVRARKRLGLPHHVSSYRNSLGPRGNDLFGQAPTYAHLKTLRDSTGRDVTSELTEVRKAFWILASSFLCCARRKDAAMSLRPRSLPGAMEDITIFDRSGDKFNVTFALRSPIQPNICDEHWRNVSREYHFFDLLKVLEGQRTVNEKWRQSLVRASVLAGQSFLARHVAEAFFSDMVAVETLLTRRGDKFPDALIQRLVALFGWITGDDPGPFVVNVERLYKLRCGYVHDGHSGDISGMDLFLADTLLKNLLMNLCKNTRHIRSKDDIVDLAEKIQAKRTLGLRMGRRPGRMYFSQPTLTPSLRKEIDNVAWSW